MKQILTIGILILGHAVFAQSSEEIAKKYFSEALNSTIQGRTDDAITNYEKAIQTKPDYSDALYNLGAIYYNKALELAGSVQSQDSTYAIIMHSRDSLYNKAADCFEKVVTLNPTDAQTLGSLKQIYVTLEEYEKAAVVKKKLDALDQEKETGDKDKQ